MRNGRGKRGRRGEVLFTLVNKGELCCLQAESGQSGKIADHDLVDGDEDDHKDNHKDGFQLQDNHKAGLWHNLEVNLENLKIFEDNYKVSQVVDKQSFVKTATATQSIARWLILREPVI